MIQNDCHIHKTGNVKYLVKKASLKYQYHPRITTFKVIVQYYYFLSQLPACFDK